MPRILVTLCRLRLTGKMGKNQPSSLSLPKAFFQQDFYTKDKLCEPRLCLLVQTMTATSTAFTKYSVADPSTAWCYSSRRGLMDTKNNKLEQKMILRDLWADRQAKCNILHYT